MTDHSSRQIFVAYMNIISSCNEVLCFLALTSWLPRSSWYWPLQHERYMIHCELASWIPIDRSWFSERRNEFAPRAVTVGDCSDPGGTRAALPPPLSALVFFPVSFITSKAPYSFLYHPGHWQWPCFTVVSFILPPEHNFFFGVRKSFEGLE